MLNTSKTLHNFFFRQVIPFGKHTKNNVRPCDKCCLVRSEKGAQAKVVLNVSLDMTINITMKVRVLGELESAAARRTV